MRIIEFVESDEFYSAWLGRSQRYNVYNNINIFYVSSEFDPTHRDPKAASVSAAGDMYLGT